MLQLKQRFLLKLRTDLMNKKKTFDYETQKTRAINKLNKAIKQKQNEVDKEFEPYRQMINDEFYEYKLYNSSYYTYDIANVKITDYGYFFLLYTVPGLSFSKLQEHLEEIEQDLSCIWLMEFEKFSKYAKVRVVTKALDKDLPYHVPEKMKPNLIYLGLSMSYHPILVDVIDYCMVMIAGATRSGKTRYIYTMLMCFICGCSPREVEIYLSDCAKNEYCQFKDVKHVRYYADDLDKLFAMLNHVDKIMDQRKEILSRTRDSGTATNIREFNEAVKDIRDKLSFVYVLIDEFSILNIAPYDNYETKLKKQYIFYTLEKISKMGAGLGVFTINAMQKTSKDELGNAIIIRNMSSVRISFRANDRSSSDVIVGNGGAVGLLSRYAVFSLNGGCDQDLFFVPKLTTEKLQEMLKPHIDKNFPKPNIEMPSLNDKVIQNVAKKYKKQNQQDQELEDEEFTIITTGTKKNY